MTLQVCPPAIGLVLLTACALRPLHEQAVTPSGRQSSMQEERGREHNHLALSTGRRDCASHHRPFWVLPPRLELQLGRWLTGVAPSRRLLLQDRWDLEAGWNSGHPAVVPADALSIGSLTGSPRVKPGITGRCPASLGLSPYDDAIRSSAARHDLDWLLIAALISQESGFNPCRVSSAGAVGLAQVLPSTAHELGILDPWDPEQNIEAGARYLRRMYDRFEGREETDRVACALASYCAGPGHVLDACSLAATDGRDPLRWAGHVEETMAQLANPDFAVRATHGSARGHHVVAFTNLVLKRWRAYADTVESREGDSSGGIF